MAKRVFIHIGAPKAASTYIQSTLWTNREALAEAGVCVPGRSHSDHTKVEAFLRSSKPSGNTSRIYNDIVMEIADWPDTAILSQEWFTLSSTQQIYTFVHHLKNVHEHVPEIHVIFNARDLVSSVTAAWQEQLKLGYGYSIEEIVSNLSAETVATKGPKYRWKWSTLDPAEILPRWNVSIPSHQIHVVPIPPRSLGSDALWKRYSKLLGIDDVDINLTNLNANESIDVESAALLQLIGPSLRRALDVENANRRLPHKWIRHYVSNSILSNHDGNKIGLPENMLSILCERAEASTSYLRKSNFHIVGALDELELYTSEDRLCIENVTDTDILDAASELIPSLLQRLRVETDRADTLERQNRKLKSRVNTLRRKQASSNSKKPTSLTTPLRRFLSRR